MREKKKKGERENFEFWQREYRNSCCPKLAARVPKWKLIVAIPLPKQEKKNCGNYGNDIAKNGKKINRK